jgi:hypothetical protein
MKTSGMPAASLPHVAVASKTICPSCARFCFAAMLAEQSGGVTIAMIPKRPNGEALRP